MLRQRTHVSWRDGRDRPLIRTTYEDRGPATTRVTRPSPVRYSYDGELAALIYADLGAVA